MESPSQSTDALRLQSIKHALPYHNSVREIFSICSNTRSNYLSLLPKDILQLVQKYVESLPNHLWRTDNIDSIYKQLDQSGDRTLVFHRNSHSFHYSADLGSSKQIDWLLKADLLCLISHPNLLNVHEAFVQEKHITIVFEAFPDSISLDSFITNRQPLFNESQVRELTKQLLGLVMWLSALDIPLIVEPADCFVTSTSIKLEFLRNELPPHYLDVDRIPLPQLIGPEEMMCESTSREVSSLWSVGCIVYSLLFCKYPFEADSVTQLLLKIRRIEYDLDGGSALARDFIRGLLMRQEERRTTAACLAHEWFKTKV